MVRQRLFCVMAGTVLCANLAAETRVWETDFTKGAAAWTSGRLKNIRVCETGLAFESPGGDSPLFSPVFDGFPVSAWQRVAIELQSDVSGQALLYWTNTTEGQYGGFSPTKVTAFGIEAGPEFKTYTLQPCWQSEKKIIHLRFNPPGGGSGKLVLRRVRVLDDLPPECKRWPAQNVPLDATNTWRARVELPASEYSYLVLRISSAEAGIGSLTFFSQSAPQAHTIEYYVRPDGKLHTCNVPLDDPQWTGTIAGLILKAGGKPGSTTIESLEFSAVPGGPPDIEVRSFAAGAYRPRAGTPVRLEATIVNHGRATAIQPRLDLKGARVVASSQASVRLETDVPEGLTWSIQADQAGPAEATLSFDTSTVRSVIAFAQPVATAKADYVPVPVPAKTEYQIGVYYFPGWDTATAWSPLRPFPERRPLLGWYREGDPEVLDWQIKWMVEHGITFVLYDWYWDRGGRHLEHGIHKALFNARYRDMLKFCLLYANHNPPGSHSAQDFEALTRFWIENYFKRANYLRVQGKPVVVFFAPGNPIKDMGTENVRKSFDNMRKMCQDAGVEGLYLVACSGPDPKWLPQLKACGYDAVSCYNWIAFPNMTGEELAQKNAPYAKVAAGYANGWKELAATNELKVIPPVSGGWDSRPWHGAQAQVRYGRTPEVFKRHLEDCKRFLDEQEQEPKLKMAFIEAWNEWGEGSYIEPHQEFGFGYLEAIRQVFAPNSPRPDEALPEELGRGPYDVPEPAYATNWDFRQAANTLQWSGNVSNLRIENGALMFTTSGQDPILLSPGLRIHAAEWPVLKLRVKAARDLKGQVFWATASGLPHAESRRCDFDIKGDDAFHDIAVKLSVHPRWRGLISNLRLDPGSLDGVNVAIESIGFAKAE